MNDAEKDKLRELRVRAEELAELSTVELTELKPEEIKSILQELQVHQIELELQNEELRRTQRELEEARGRFFRLYHHAPVGYLVLNRTGLIVQTNATFAASVGREGPELQEKPFAELLVDEDRPIFLARLRSFFRKPEDKTFSFRVGSKEGSFYYARMRAARTQLDEKVDELGYEHLLVTIDDVSELVIKDRQLRASEERFRKIVNVLPPMISYVDRSLTYRFVNPSYPKVFGIPEEQIVGRTVVELIGEEAFERAKPYIERVLDGEVVEYDEEFDYPIGRRNIFGQLVPDTDWSGEVRGYHAVLTDVTAMKMVEREKLELTERLLQSQKMEAVGRLAGGVAHDFNNILVGITGFSSLIQMDLPEESPIQDLLGEIDRAADRATELTKQLLAFSRREVLKPRILDLNELIGDLRLMLRRLIGEHIELKTLLTEPLGRVKADPGHIEQIIVNLIVNARDAMLEGGQLIIETRLIHLDPTERAKRALESEGPFVVLEVHDNGEGMDEETRDLIFEPFFTTKNKQKGTGLGLATVYGLVHQHGGHIEVESRRGEGSTFRVLLPQASSVNPSPGAKPASDEMPRGAETLLVVEDEPSVISVAVQTLKRLGYQVLSACSGEEALSLFDEYGDGIAMILTDVIMPKMNGRELVDELKGRRGEIKVLFMSGYTDELLGRQGMLDEDTELMSKPFSAHELAQRVRSVLDS